MTAQCSDENHLPAAFQRIMGDNADCTGEMRQRRDIPISGSRREAIGMLIEAACDAQNTWSAYSDKVNKIQAAINYMIMHDGW